MVHYYGIDILLDRTQRPSIVHYCGIDVLLELNAHRCCATIRMVVLNSIDIIFVLDGHQRYTSTGTQWASENNRGPLRGPRLKE
jgi:hypothetical protein